MKLLTYKIQNNSLMPPRDGWQIKGITNIKCLELGSDYRNFRLTQAWFDATQLLWFEPSFSEVLGQHLLPEQPQCANESLHLFWFCTDLLLNTTCALGPLVENIVTVWLIWIRHFFPAHLCGTRPMVWCPTKLLNMHSFYCNDNYTFISIISLSM